MWKDGPVWLLRLFRSTNVLERDKLGMDEVAMHEMQDGSETGGKGQVVELQECLARAWCE